MVTAVPGLALGITTADCGPVLFADPEARVIGAAHAGLARGGDRRARIDRSRPWSGSAQGDDKIVAVLGPTIGQNGL